MPIPEKPEQTSAVLWIDYNGAAKTVPIRHANQAAVQFQNHEFYLSLFELNPPVLIGSIEEQKRQLGNAESIVPECIARINMTARFAREVIKALQTELDKYDKNERSGG